MNFLDEVEKGKQGVFEGLPNCFNRLNSYLYNTQRQTYYILGGTPGSGKTGLCDENFVLAPFFELKIAKQPINVRWLYYSFEISKKAKVAKWVSNLIYKMDGTVVDPNQILSKGGLKITPDIEVKVHKVMPVIDELLSYITFIDEPQTPNQIYRDLLNHAESNGKFTYEEYTDENGIMQKRRIGYIANNPDDYFIPIIDHVGLTKREKGLSKKENIDKLSSMLVYFRNLCGYSPVVTSQLNRGLSSVDRQKFHAQDLAPTLDDLKDTGSLAEDCNVALGLFHPYNFNLKSYLGYDLTQLKNNFRAVNIMKNRDGGSDVNIGCQFIGGSGYYIELPKAENFTLGVNNYQDYIK